MSSTTRGRFVTLSSGFLATETLSGKFTKERPAPDPYRQRGAEDHHGVDALPAGSCPVHVLEVEPQRELVEGQRGTNAICDRGHARQKVRAGALFDQPDVADDQDQKDAPHQVMNVKPAARYVVERADTCPNEVGDPAHRCKGDQEPERRQEQPLPAFVLEVKTVDPLEGGQTDSASEGSPVAGAPRELVFEDHEIRARQRVDVSLEGKRPVLSLIH